MLERLGNVLYWVGLALALGFTAFAAWVLAETGDRRPGFIAFVFAPALASWLIGLACRYVMTDKS